MRLLVLFLSLALAACSSAASPGPTSSASPEPSTPVAASAELLGKGCRLPVSILFSGGDSAMYQGGFVQFPQATFQPDPEGKMVSDYQSGSYVTIHKPELGGLPGGGTPFYDAATSRWVPVSPPQSDPTGTSYAWVSLDRSKNIANRVHVVNARTAADRSFPADEVGYSVSVQDFGPAGVYVSSSGGIGGYQDVWLLDLNSGGLKKLLTAGDLLAVRDGYAWTGSRKVPIAFAEHPLPDTISRVDLATGATVTWYQTTGDGISFKGFDGHGKPVVQIAHGQQPFNEGEIRVVESPGSRGTLISPSGRFSAPQGDGDQIWFGSTSGISLYSPGVGLRLVYPYTGYPNPDNQMAPAGFCR